jgi:hypothetical protein
MGTLSSAAGLCASFQERLTSRGWIQTDMVIYFGASSITAVVSDHPDIGAVRTGTGQLSLTFPPAVAARIYQTEIYSPGLTVIDSVVTAKTATAGVATHKVLNPAGAATDPASGDILTLRLELLTEI